MLHCPPNLAGAVTGAEDGGEEFHEQTWFIVVVVLVGLITVTFVILMMVCVVRSVRNNKSNEGKYNGKMFIILRIYDYIMFFFSGRY